MTKLHEVIAVEGDLSSAAQKLMEDAITTFTKRPATFEGQTRTVEMYDESRAGENETESKTVGYTVDQKIDFVGKHVTKYYDVLMQKECTNATAVADILIDGIQIAADVPATMLLGLENRLKSLRAVYNAIPTLDPSFTWNTDATLGEGVYRSQVKESQRTEKTIDHKVLYEATKEHPAQIREYSIDKPVAKIETTKFSGMITVSRKAELMERIDTLILAVKQARQRANQQKVVDKKIGNALLTYINTGATV